MASPQSNGKKELVIQARDIVVGFGDHLVLKGADLDVHRGEILGFVGGSGAGKSVLMRTIIGLIHKREGSIKVFGVDMDTLIATLQRTLGLTVFMVTHDLDSLHTVCDRIAVLVDGKVIAAGTMDAMLASEQPWMKAYFHGKRARALEKAAAETS